MVAQNAVLLGAEPFDAAPALMVEKMRAESTAMQSSFSNACVSNSNLHWVLIALR